MKSRYTLASIIGIGVIFLCLMIALPLLNGESGFLRTAQSNQQVHAETMREEGEAGEEADAEAKTKELEALAKVWAYALQTRDGKPRFDMMSDQAKEKFIQEQIIRAGEDWNYNIGYSSPWVEEFKIEVNEWTATITYLTRTSEPAYYYSMETVTFAEEKDSYVVANYDTVIDAEKLTDDIHWDLDTGTAVLENKWPILLSELDQSKGRLSAIK
ncbi:hypothetical protein [Caldalkalibacillus mannanilyticus]|uniref:hypothetical protein n=1 Tax=Caldalkalibacillus mannanilyticus TaxID=1418 RepID=UPI0004683181|nr:hypothetical protein [Caldalkalibacillus mannanilyticus]